jgi:hypothetical protein
VQPFTAPAARKPKLRTGKRCEFRMTQVRVLCCLRLFRGSSEMEFFPETTCLASTVECGRVQAEAQDVAQVVGETTRSGGTGEQRVETSTNAVHRVPLLRCRKDVVTMAEPACEVQSKNLCAKFQWVHLTRLGKLCGNKKPPETTVGRLEQLNRFDPVLEHGAGHPHFDWHLTGEPSRTSLFVRES